MAKRYRVSIPVEATTQDGVDVSITHKLDHDLILADVLRVRVEGPITYLEFEVAAEERNTAITSALTMAWRVVQLISLIYNKGFEVSLAGIQAIPIAPTEPAFEVREEADGTHLIIRETIHISDHIRVTEHISTLDPLLPLWERLAQSNNVVADGLEWLYFGKIASNERMAFLACWLAFELLVERAPGNEQATTIVKKYVPEKNMRALLRQEMKQVLSKYIEDGNAQDRLLAYLDQAKLESDIDRWTRILQSNGVKVQQEEVLQLKDMRGAIVHQTNKNKDVAPSPRLRELVAEYLDVLVDWLNVRTQILG